MKTTVKIKSMQELQDELFLENTTALIKALEYSLSLGKNEKKRVILSIPDLSQFQITGLIKVFEDEAKEFARRSNGDPEFAETVRILTERAKKEWEEMQENK